MSSSNESTSVSEAGSGEATTVFTTPTRRQTTVDTADANRFAGLVSGRNKTSHDDKGEDSPSASEPKDGDKAESSAGSRPKGASHSVHGKGEDGDRRDRDQDPDEDRDRDRAKGPLLTAGDQILRGLVGNQPAPTSSSANTVDTPSEAGTAGEQIDAIAAQVAHRILVTDPGTSTNHEVHIQLRGDLLGGTEVQISRQQGQVLVRFLAPTSDQASQIQANASTLAQAVNHRVNASVHVEVDVQGGGAQQQGSSGSNADASSGDGRSRNRRSPWEPWDNSQDLDG